eukprot:8011763-Pyramimonas_sp.AAC.1
MLAKAGTGHVACGTARHGARAAATLAASTDSANNSWPTCVSPTTTYGHTAGTGALTSTGATCGASSKSDSHMQVGGEAREASLPAAPPGQPGTSAVCGD